MRTLTPAISDTLASTTRRPAIKVELFDPIQHWARYQNTLTTEGRSAACIAPDGSIIRAYTDHSAGVFTSSLFVQRITDPGNAAQWSTWTTLSSANLLREAGCAVSNNGGTLRLFAQSGVSPFPILRWTSTDNGATWNGPITTIASIGAAVRGIGSAGQDDLFYAFDSGGGVALAVSLFSGGSFGPPATWTLGILPACLGIDAAWDSTNTRFVLAVSDGRRIDGYSYTTAPAWSLIGPIAPLDSATAVGLARAYPRLAVFDTLFHLAYLEVDTGAFTGLVYSYARLRESADFLHWSDGILLEEIMTYGPTWLKAPTPPAGNAGPGYYVVNNRFAWRAEVYNPANPTQYLDVSAQVLEIQRHEERNRTSRLLLRLSNAGGQYNTLPMLGPHTSVRLSEGYHDPATDSMSVTPVGIYYVDRYQYVRAPDHHELLITARDASKRLDRAARLQTSYSGKTLAWLLTELAARAGLLAVSLPATSQFSQSVPLFVAPAGHTLRQALNDLCSIYAVSYFLDQTETLQFRELSPADAAVWTYQPEIEALTLESSEGRANHIIVTGRTSAGALVYGESYDFAHLMQTGLERPLYHTDPRLTSATQAQLKADLLLADEQRRGSHHTVQVPAHPGLQLLDVILLTDSAAPTGTGHTSRARISALHVSYIPQEARFDMTLTLEQP